MGMGWQKKLPDGRWRAFESHGSGAARVQSNATRETRRDARQAAQDALERKLRRTIGLEPHRSYP